MAGLGGKGADEELTVVVPSAYRPSRLGRCLAALCSQTRGPEQIVVVLRPDDETGSAVCGLHPGVRVVPVNDAGLVAARNDGLRSVRTPWVAFLDDDAEAAPDWCERLHGYFSDPTVGAVGGPIMNFVGARSTSGWFHSGVPVARIGYAGRTKSHLHDQPDRRVVEDVDFLPGSNMALRCMLARTADHGRAPGLAPGEELEWCLTVKDRGYRVVYDSAIRVAHYSAMRVGSPSRGDAAAYSYAYSYMLTHTLLRHFGALRSIVFLVYFFLVGQRVSPGVALFPIYATRTAGMSKIASGLRGRWRAFLDLARSRYIRQ